MSRALILSGGGFRGAVQVPIIESLVRLYDYDAVYGVSVGALNGALFAQKEIDLLWKLWLDVDGIGGFFRLSPWPFNGIYSMKPMREKIETHGRLSKLKTTFYAGVVSLTDGEYYNLSSSQMFTDKEYWDAIEASSSISGAMKSPSIEINGTLHKGADGGFRNIIPMPEQKYDYIDVCPCTPLQRIKKKAPKHWNLGTLLFRGVEIMEDEIFDQYQAQMLTKLNPGGEITVYAPQEDTGFSFDASRALISKRIDIGRQALSNPLKLISPH